MLSLLQSEDNEGRIYDEQQATWTKEKGRMSCSSFGPDQHPPNELLDRCR